MNNNHHTDIFDGWKWDKSEHCVVVGDNIRLQLYFDSGSIFFTASFSQTISKVLGNVGMKYLSNS